ncbi:hypothetical protein K501DRAFT_285494 [Backusella circina FSU 941]|nr:hypothetical protein K501DRAFT_285494 [Backusella circina FSU 941]
MSYTQYNSVRHIESENYSSTTSLSLIVQELTDSEVSTLSPSVIQASLEKPYEIRDEDRLSEHDFYSLMNSEDEESLSESESDVEYHWFPSLLNHSSIQFLDDDDGDNTVVSEEEVKVEIEEEEDSDTQEEESMNGRKRRRHHQKHSKKHKKSRRADIIPVEVVYVDL